MHAHKRTCMPQFVTYQGKQQYLARCLPQHGHEPRKPCMCYSYRNPPPGGEQQKPMAWAAIARLVWNVDGKTHPTPDAVRKCVVAWRQKKKARGCQLGWRKTTAAEDKKIMAAFHKARNPRGSLVTSRDVASRLPHKLRTKDQ